MKTIAIVAPTGMLGSSVYGVLHDRYQLVLVLRDKDKLPLLEKAYGPLGTHRVVPFDISDLEADYASSDHGFLGKPKSPRLEKLVNEIGPIDAIVNAAGITNRYSTKNPAGTFFINGGLPHILSAEYGPKLIHITTDCVFNGVVGAPYTENSPKTPYDLYGLSKLVGEPDEQSLVLRTSIIGPEIAGFVSLISWVQQQEGQTVNGYTKHLWNGITTKQFGKIVETIVSNRSAYPTSGLFHVFGSDVTKFEMVQAIAKHYQVGVTINPDNGPVLDRRLRTVKELNAQLHIPDFQTMLDELG